MTAEEVQNKYHIPQEILEEYHIWGLCDAVRMVMADWQYTDIDIARLSDIMALHDMGFSSEMVEVYMKLLLQGDSTTAQRMKILNEQRGKTLEDIHFRERQIERMDYLRHEIREATK